MEGWIRLQTHLYFVRHAHSTYTPDELGRPLSEQGFADASMVTALLKKEAIDEVYASPYERAIQTVEGIAEYIDKEMKLVEGLKERTLAEKTVEDFQQAIIKVWQDDDFAWKGGESNRAAQKRGVHAVL
ncbi:histidine phosphatase family protein [Gracilibacillus timonensis]|uniref:histidine phosphatase family protein n=1 Tax=Gracilibacillus timonensis TaxID=1816696 RepID=UPI0008256CFB|nr:histidine phosphatase family protein [Gracilibacillus timonensis]